MNKALEEFENRKFENAAAAGEAPKYHDWRKKMSDNVALALIAYTGLHIFATVGAIKATGLKSLALAALVILVAGIIPACRWFEKRWTNLSDEEAVDLDLTSAFRRDQLALWALALGLPILITTGFTLAA